VPTQWRKCAFRPSRDRRLVPREDLWFARMETRRSIGSTGVVNETMVVCQCACFRVMIARKGGDRDWPQLATQPRHVARSAAQSREERNTRGKRTTYVAPLETETHEGRAAGGGDASIGAGNRSFAESPRGGSGGQSPSERRRLHLLRRRRSVRKRESVGSHAPLTSPTETVSASNHEPVPVCGRFEAGDER
jgi:hypothetical protein